MTSDDESPPVSGGSDTAPQPRKARRSESAPKRRRIALACSACRIRKSRCNGRRPKCDTCERLGFDCSYEQQETAANILVPRDLFAALETKVKLLETSLVNQNNRLTAVENARPKPMGSHLDRQIAHHPPSGNVVVNIDGIHDGDTDQSMTDGMAVSFVDEEDCGFFGPSSNIAFMRHILGAIDAKKPSNRHLPSIASASEHSAYSSGLDSSSNTLPATSLGVSGKPHKVGANLLPSDQKMQKLIHAYFANTGLLFPYIHQEEFLSTYRQFRASGFRNNVRRTWLGLLNMVFAMATCTSCWEDSGSENHFEQSSVYYQRAEELCQTQMLRGTTLEIVQYLLLMSQYLQGTQKSVHTWSIHGLAVKAAMSIGLHSKDIASKFTPLQQEIRKRTWFGCILLDRSLSMTFGRPSTIPEEYIRLDLPKPLPLSPSVSEEVQQLSTEFFNASILLYRIMGKIIIALYGNNIGCDDPASDIATVTSIFQFGQELSDWQSNLPPQLSLFDVGELPQDTHTETQESTVDRFRVILTLRYLNIQLLLHRPTYVQLLGASLKNSMASHHNQASANSFQADFDRTFFQAAEHTIDVLYAILMRPDHGRRLIGAWWYTLYYAFSAALAVLGSLLISQGSNVENDGVNRLSRARSSLNQVSKALLRLSSHSTIVLRCVEFLQQLLRIVNGWDSRSVEKIGSQELYLNPDLNVSGPATQFNFGVDLFSTMPTWNASDTGFGDELELGHFFASDFQKWYNQIQW